VTPQNVVGIAGQAQKVADKYMLIGEYTHTLDPKKRLALPAKFRKELGKKVVLTHGLDNCLFLYPLKEWNRVAERLGNLSIGQADTRGFNRFMLAGAVETDVDSIGRILIPDFLKEFAGLSERVIVAGVQVRLEIWDEPRWSAYKKRIRAQADQLAQKLGEIGAI
jgi:MraZ protein